MGISLNDHENRIKKLESISTGPKTYKKIYSYGGSGTGLPATLSQPITDFDFIIIGSMEYCIDHNDCITSAIVAVSDVVAYPKVGIGNPINGNNNSGVALSITGNKITHIGNQSWKHLRYVYGLKLYYSFSYNIIYKILRSKISRLANILTFQSLRNTK